MPIDRDDERIARSPASYRRQLIDGTGGAAFQAHPFSLRVSNVPLFQDRDGRLFQAVRVRIRQSGSGQELIVRLKQGDQILDEQHADITNQPQSVFLLVPEVREPTSLRFEAESQGALLWESDILATPQRKWTIHLIHHSHYDIGYTDPQSEVMSSQLGYIDAVLELCTVTDEWPDPARFRWNIEVTWPLKHWLLSRPKSARDQLIRRINEGRIEVHALPFSMHTEAYSFDELAQQLQLAQELREDYGINIVSAMQTDVPGATIGLSTLLTDADIKYFSVAHNYAGRSVPYLHDGQELNRPFYWEAPDGDRLLVWYTDTLNGVAYMEGMTLGFGAGYDDVLGSLPEYLKAVSERPYPYGDGRDWIVGDLSGIELNKAPFAHDVLNLRIQGAFADNASASILPSTITREWNERWAYPRLRMSLNRDFFSDVEDKLGDQIDTYKGDWTDWWADGIGSAAVPLARNRQAQSDIRTAQTLNVIANVVTDEARPDLHARFQTAYENMALFDEHTWGAANPWEQGSFGMNSGEYQWTRKAAFAYSAEEETRILLEGGLRRLSPLAAGTQVRHHSDSLLVFNPSGHVRTDLVRVFLPERDASTHPIELTDLTSGATVPFILEPQSNSFYRPRGQYIRFLARDVPSIGYARYGLTSRAIETAGVNPIAQKAGTPNTTMDNEFLNLDVDVSSASIRTLTDQANGTELIASDAPYGFNAYIFDRYTSAPRFNHLSGRIGSAGPWLLGSRATGQYGLIMARESNAVWERMTLRYEGDGADWLETTITLPHGVARLHVSNRFHKPSNMEKESVYYAFPFALEKPEITFEVTGGFTSPTSPHVPGSAQHFRAIRRWITLSDRGKQTLAWSAADAPLVQMGNIHLPYAPFPTTIDTHEGTDATIYSWALNNIWDTNFPPQQGGEMTFRYVIASGQGEDSMELGADTGESASTPLLGMIAPLGDPGIGTMPDRASFVEVADARVKVSHLAPTRSGQGINVILESHAAEPVETTIHIPHFRVRDVRLGTFWETDLIQADVHDNVVNVTIAPGELRSVVLDFEQG
jgi:hypothetical protein